MPVEISLTVPRRIEREEAMQAISEAARSEAVLEWKSEIDGVEFFNVTFPDPASRRNERLVRAHVATDLDGDCVSGKILGEAPDYTYFTSGAHGGMPAIFKALAVRFGGVLEDESKNGEDAVETFPDPQAAPAP